MPSREGHSFPLNLPNVGLIPIAFSSGGLALVYVALILSGLIVFLRQIQSCTGFYSTCLNSALLLLPLLHQYGTLVFVCLLIGLGVRGGRRILLSSLRRWWVFLLVSFSFWTVLGVIHAFGSFVERNLPYRCWQVFISLFANFEIHYRIVYPFAFTVPVFFLIMIMGIGIAVVAGLTTSRRQLAAFPLLVGLVCIFMVPIFRTTYHATRYSFFFFPVLLCILYASTLKLKKAWNRRAPHARTAFVARGVIFVPVFLFLVSEDFSPRHLINVSSQELNFRLGGYDRLAVHWYPRFDFKTPAEYVNRSRAEEDVVVTDQIVSAHYLKKPYVNYVSLKSRRLRGMSRKGGTEEIWTGQPLIYSFDGLRSLMPRSGHGRLWLVTGLGKGPGHIFKKEANLFAFAESRQLRATKEYSSIDGRVGVYRFDPVPLETNESH
jgi:hypothetical protein